MKNGTPGTTADPDKVLYDRSLDDIKHGRYDVGRLNLQTLINTYPDSEYLAKAKLAIADSYYKEGGPGSLNQAILEYKDFITFFPFLDEAAYAQMQVGMAHYRQMMKPDRDTTEALDAESEFQTLLQNIRTARTRRRPSNGYVKSRKFSRRANTALRLFITIATPTAPRRRDCWN